MTQATLRPALAALTFVAALWCAPDAGARGMRAADPWAVARPAPAVGDIVTTPLCEGFHLGNSLDASGVAPGRPLWLSRDPLGERGGLNLYGFVGNDPVNSIDYLGMVEVPLSKDIVPLLAATSGQENLERLFVQELFKAGIDPSKGADRAKLASVFSGFESFWGAGGYETAFIGTLKDVYGGALLGVHDARMAAFDARPRTSTNPFSGQYFTHKAGVFKTAAIGAAEDTIDFGLELLTLKSAISTIADGQTTRFTFSGLEYEKASEFDEAMAYASFFLALTPAGLADDAARGLRVSGGVSRTSRGGGATLSASARGNPTAILHGFGGLSKRQRLLLDQLPDYGSRAVLKKSGVSIYDLNAMTAATGDEFLLLTRKGERVVMRGGQTGFRGVVTEDWARDMASQGWRLSAHTHPDVPGVSAAQLLFSSEGDQAILKLFGQSRSAILTPQTSRVSLFGSAGDF